ncbi:MAG TPA: hypothetical protein VMC09_12220 [Anaerolineales bacterium]|nr:hypothetical protein [Anaerolineales bacterium]
MQHRKLSFWLMTAGLMLLFTVGMFFLLPARPVSAQCGSQASSCKNCHETQGQKPVTNDGTAWHDANHTLIDSCAICHAGNSQATDETAAHTGLADPLSDVAASCKSCHPKDYQARAQVFATSLGVTLGAGSPAATTAASAPAASAATATTVPAATQAAAVVPAADIVDYSQRYDEVALGKKPANVGNIIMIVLIVALVLGAGLFIARREGWFKISFQDTKTIQGSYPADVVDMVPDLAKLKPAARKDLRTILSKPATAAELFALVIKFMKKDDSSTLNEKENL